MADKSVNAEQSAAMEELIQRMCSRLDDKLDDWYPAETGAEAGVWPESQEPQQQRESNPHPSRDWQR